MAADVRNVWSIVSELPEADVTAAAAITDNSGGIDPGNDTVAVITNPDLSNWDGATVFPSAAQATAIGAAFTAVKAAIKQITTKLNLDSTAVTALETAINDLKDSFVLKG